MATGKNSLKTKDFSTNPKAGLCFFEAGNSIAMIGMVEIVADNATKEKFGKTGLSSIFPKELLMKITFY